MKRITIIALGLFVSLAAVATASAQEAVTAKVPFGFYIGNAWLPAGTYTVTSDANRNLITVRDSENKIALLKMVLQSGEQPRTNALVFKQYGDRYFLHEIEATSHGMNLAIPASKREKAAESEKASTAPATEIYLALLK